MKPVLFFILLFSIPAFFSCKNQESFDISKREQNFNENWKFIRFDESGAEKPDFDDSAWRTLNLPHDYSIEDLPEKQGVKQTGPFSEESQGKESTGHVVGGTAWYRKHFTLGKEDEGKIVKILFDGIYMNADVWINGTHLGNHPYGYTAFSFDLTPYLHRTGEKNVLAVQVKNHGKNSRWYSGSGIYRDVTLVKTNPLHVDLWGVFVSTSSVSTEGAKVAVDVSLTNAASENKKFTFAIDFTDPDGNPVPGIVDEKTIGAGDNITFSHEFTFADYRLWSVEEPELYAVTVRLLDGNKTIDEVTESFGIRSIEFSAEKGFLLNGKSVLLKGGCLHHDNGHLGSATFKTAEYRRVKTMKGNGFNAIRTAHNPPSKTFLDACDQLGMLVIDESFDHWQKPKNPQDYHLYFDEWWERDIKSMVKRDRNHPSIIIWSVGNEIKERADSSGLEIFKKLRGKVLEFDPTRPVTQAVCSFWDNPGKTWENTEPVFALMDVHSYNYQWKQYEPDHARFPDRIMIGSESIAQEAFENWQQVEKHPYVIGDFVWTGMDHLGESGIGHAKLDNDTTKFLPPWPWFINNSGDIDLLGNKKPQMYFRDVVWRNSELEMLVHTPIPAGRKEIVSFWGWPDEMKSWNWTGNEGTLMQVSVYTRCQEVRLELNGNVIGTKQVSEDTKLTARFDVPYQPGELTAIGITEGKEVTRQTLKTTGVPSQIKIAAESGNIDLFKDDLAYFNIEILDENGMLVPDAEIPVEFEIQGNCKIQAVGNSNPTDMKSFQQPKVNTFRGRCQLVLKTSSDDDQIVVTAKSGGLITATSTVKMVKK